MRVRTMVCVCACVYFSTDIDHVIWALSPQVYRDQTALIAIYTLLNSRV